MSRTPHSLDTLAKFSTSSQWGMAREAVTSTGAKTPHTDTPSPSHTRFLLLKAVLVSHAIIQMAVILIVQTAIIGFAKAVESNLDITGLIGIMAISFILLVLVSIPALRQDICHHIRTTSKTTTK